MPVAYVERIRMAPSSTATILELSMVKQLFHREFMLEVFALIVMDQSASPTATTQEMLQGNQQVSMDTLKSAEYAQAMERAYPTVIAQELSKG